MSGQKYAFVDESGDTNVDLSIHGASAHYVMTAVVVDEDDLDGTRDSCDKTRRSFFGSGEMKSSRVGSNDRRRATILEELATPRYWVYSLAVDKSELTSKGFADRGVFFKHLYGRLYRVLVQDMAHLHVFADEYGTTEFMHGFREYVRRRLKPDLFMDFDMGFVDSKSEVMIQAADMIGGSIAREWTARRAGRQAGAFMKILDARVLYLDTFPQVYTAYLKSDTESAPSEYDKVIGEAAIQKANQFIAEHEDSSDEQRMDQVLLLRILRYHSFIDPTRYVMSSRLLSGMNELRREELERRLFHANVVAKLRDAGVMLASSNRGYKLPTSVDDLRRFVNISSSNVLPQLARIETCRDSVLRATENKVDILADAEFQPLRKALEAVRSDPMGDPPHA